MLLLNAINFFGLGEKMREGFADAMLGEHITVSNLAGPHLKSWKFAGFEVQEFFFSPPTFGALVIGVASHLDVMRLSIQTDQANFRDNEKFVKILEDVLDEEVQPLPKDDDKKTK